ncbi:Hsp20/alpha crystallin family protein [Tepidanaerobacter sp. GT38]|uniref:Hsp20/alpha crystallin family protein n=1 Tax=Tepidanaerobacter sp. GT38 TaxID=2722793 RepID=UPI001F311DF0|nr:Hsp20/alpha crystallin family protein [Tepidanaerobacter sp. GT38]MCG1012912.1 Hsp20/alpha crystallin family protein [Tepidanaerobacter sp. GT38]
MRDRGLIPRKRRGLLPAFFDWPFDTEDLLDMFNLSPVKADLRETENEYIVEADLPGYKKENIEILYEDNVLTISAKYDEVTEEKGESFIQRERRRGNYSRSIPIPSNVKDDEIRASFNNGVLKVILPKVEPSRPSGRIIDIE